MIEYRGEDEAIIYGPDSVPVVRAYRRADGWHAHHLRGTAVWTGPHNSVEQIRGTVRDDDHD